MVLDAHLETGIVCHCNQGYAGPYAGPQDGKPGVAATLEPIERGPAIDDGLANCMKCPAEVGREHIIRTDEFIRHSEIVIRQTDAEGREAEPLHHAAERHVAVRVGPALLTSHLHRHSYWGPIHNVYFLPIP